MKVDTAGNRIVERSGLLGTFTFGVKKGGLAHIFKVLRDTLYSDKIRAVLREPSTNGFDSHKEAGIEPVFDVYLPTILHTQFRVRDYGIGLSDTGVEEIFSMYGESTKRDSNDYIGQLGLGSKAPFAYSPNFSVITFCDANLVRAHRDAKSHQLDDARAQLNLAESRVEGKESPPDGWTPREYPEWGQYYELAALVEKLEAIVQHAQDVIAKLDGSDMRWRTVFEAFIDESEVGQVSKVTEGLSDEPRGVEVLIPVKAEDIREFSLKAALVFRYFKIRPRIHGADDTLEAIKAYDELPIVLQGTGWLLKSNAPSVAIMGNIAYPLPPDVFNEGKDTDASHVAFASDKTTGLIMEFTIGQLDMAASREALDLNEKTVARLRNRMVEVVDEVQKLVAIRAGALKNPWDARVFYNEEVQNYPHAVRSIIELKPMYQGNPIELSLKQNNLHEIQEATGFELRSVNVKERSLSSAPLSVLRPTTNEWIVIEDITVPRERNARLRGFYNKHGKAVTANLARATSVLADEKELRNHEFLKGANFCYLSDFDPDYPTEKEGVEGEEGDSKLRLVKSSKHSHKLFVMDFTQKEVTRTKSDSWLEISMTEGDIIAGSGVYIPIRSFEPVSTEASWLGHTGLSHFSHILKEMDKAGISRPVQLYGFKDAMLEVGKGISPGPNWVSLKDYYAQGIKDYLRREGIAQAFFDYQAVTDQEEFYKDIGFIIPKITDQNGMFATYLKAVQVCACSNGIEKVVELGKVLSALGLRIPLSGASHFNLAEMRQEVEQTYGVMAIARDFVGPFVVEEDFQKIIIEYVDLVDWSRSIKNGSGNASTAGGDED